MVQLMIIQKDIITKNKNMKQELRMYFFVAYNLSPIQQGIQAGHAAVEYSAKYFGTRTEFLYKQFAKKHKTFIILNGGTTNDGKVFKRGKKRTHKELQGTMQKYENYLKKYNVPFAGFREPDANNALTAIAFIANKKSFNRNIRPFRTWCLIDSHSPLKLSKLDFNKLGNHLFEYEPYRSNSKKLDSLFESWCKRYNMSFEEGIIRMIIAGKKLA